ncbi:TRAP transporter small permease [Pleomorphomonas sp. PLEO]|uniref:TRAP transporter small permease n=1 Tax=Pleomorphomonas sp. PLEO TaxID=3239306 RepID=UPI00351F7650
MSSLIMRVESVVARALLAAMVGLVFMAGVMRWFGYPLVWSMDVAQLLFVWASFIGADMAMRRRGLIAVDLFVRWIPTRYRVYLDIATGLLILAFLLTLSTLGYKLVMLNLERQFGDSGISYAYVTAAVPIGCLLLAITLSGQILQALRTATGSPVLIFTPIRSKQEAIAAAGESEL